MEKQVKLFLDFLKDDKKLSENTLQSYRRDIEQYEEYVTKNKINYLKATEETITKYMQYLRDENKKESTISRSLASIRSFYQYLSPSDVCRSWKRRFPEAGQSFPQEDPWEDKYVRKESLAGAYI